MKILKEILFWVAVMTLLTFAFGQSGQNYVESFYFVSLLLPVMVGLNYFFNYFLVPKYLLTKRYWRFTLYGFYTFIVSLYLEIIVLTISFIVLANYDYQNMNPVATNVFLLCLILYFVVFLNGFTILVRRSFKKDHLITDLVELSERNREASIIVRADRKNHKINYDSIIYIESLSDYVRIHTHQAEPVVTKEKISKLEEGLPHSFIRIHRSFIVNTSKIDSFTRELVFVKGDQLPISRTYKKETINYLQKRVASEKPISTVDDS